MNAMRTPTELFSMTNVHGSTHPIGSDGTEEAPAHKVTVEAFRSTPFH